MKYSTIIIYTFFLLVLAGCSNVVSKHPIGIENYDLSSQSLDGTWLSEDEVIKLKVLQAAKGVVKLAWIEDKDDYLRFRSLTCQIKEGNNDIYLNVLEMSDERSNGPYNWGKVHIDKNKILFWLPADKPFIEAVENERIKATIELVDPDNTGRYKYKKVVLTDNPKNIVDLIEDDTGRYFDLENPIVLIRLTL